MCTGPRRASQKGHAAEGPASADHEREVSQSTGEALGNSFPFPERSAHRTCEANIKISLDSKIDYEIGQVIAQCFSTRCYWHFERMTASSWGDSPGPQKGTHHPRTPNHLVKGAAFPSPQSTIKKEPPYLLPPQPQFMQTRTRVNPKATHECLCASVSTGHVTKRQQTTLKSRWLKTKQGFFPVPVSCSSWAGQGKRPTLSSHRARAGGSSREQRMHWHLKNSTYK